MIIRPLQIIKDGINLWRKEQINLTLLCFIFYLPIFILQYPIKTQTQGSLAPFGIYGIIIMVIVILLSMYAYPALIISVAKTYSGEKWSVLGNIITAGKKFSPYLLVSFLSLLIFFLITAGSILLGLVISFVLPKKIAILVGVPIGVVAAVLGSVYFFVKLILGGLVCVLENRGPVDALKRSSGLIKHNFMGVFRFCLACLLLYFIFVAPMLIMGLLTYKGGGHAQSLPMDPLMYLYGCTIGLAAALIGTCALFTLYNQLKSQEAPIASVNT